MTVIKKIILKKFLEEFESNVKKNSAKKFEKLKEFPRNIEKFLINKILQKFYPSTVQPKWLLFQGQKILWKKSLNTERENFFHSLIRYASTGVQNFIKYPEEKFEQSFWENYFKEILGKIWRYFRKILWKNLKNCERTFLSKEILRNLYLGTEIILKIRNKILGKFLILPNKFYKN